MSNLKWADVAHYYLNSGITMKNVGKPSEYHNSWVAKDIMDLVLLDRGDIQLMPVLRALEDMTEGEETELRRLETSDETIYRAYKRVYSPIALNFLISKGFDVFGLIESGQAIRRGVENV